MKTTVYLSILLTAFGCTTEFPTRSNPHYVAETSDQDAGLQGQLGGGDGDSGVDANQNTLDATLEVEDGSLRIWDASLVQDSSGLSTDSVPLEDQGILADQSLSDAGVPPNPFYVDNDGDGLSEAEGDCNDQRADIHPGVMELCDDRADNDCNQLFDFEDPICAALTDIVVTVNTRGAVPAMVLSVESYNRTQDIDGWQVFSTAFHLRTVEVVLPAITFPSNVMCGLRFNVAFYRDPGDVAPGNNLEGDPDRWACELNEEGELINDPSLGMLQVQMNGREYDIDDFTLRSIEGESGCSLFLLFSEEGVCAF